MSKTRESGRAEPDGARPRPANGSAARGTDNQAPQGVWDFNIAQARRRGTAQNKANPALDAAPDGGRPEIPLTDEAVSTQKRYMRDAADLPSRSQTPDAKDSGDIPHTWGTGETRETPRHRHERDSGKPAPWDDAQRAESGVEQRQAPDSGKLRFAGQEQTADKPAESAKTTKALGKAEMVHGKLDKAQKKLPQKRKIRVDKGIDQETGKPKRRLIFEEEVKSRSAHLKGPLPTRPVKFAANSAIVYGHKKIYQVQDENVAVEAAHKGEIAAEGAGRLLWRRHKTAPYRKAAKLEHKVARADVKVLYRQAVDANPKLKSSAISRFMQKQKIKRDYAKAAREAKKAVSGAKKAGEKAAEALKAIGTAIKSHPAVAITVLILGLLLIFIMTATSSCSNLAGGGMSAVLATSYVAEDRNIDDAELAYAQWETDLQIQVRDAEMTYPGYDEYRYSVDDIGHNPFELMAYLSAKMQAFSYAQAVAELQSVFAEQYQLTFTPETEIRYRTETRIDPVTGESYDEQVPYEYSILNITLTARSFSEVIAPRMDTEQRGHYSLLMMTKGNRQYAAGPFDFDWIPYVSCYYGWRIHPITGAPDNHRGVDIAVAAGTEILAAHDGVITTAAYDSEYGNYLVITGEKGVVTKYAHCEAILVAQGQAVSAGDVISRVGSTGQASEPHLHFEVMKNGQYLNPLYFSITNSTDGGAAPGTPGGSVIPDYPGEPMDDARYAALMEEAMKHLGKPYVFGTSGPNTFDCSGFVCYALNQSGVASVGRTTAQGLFNMTTPVSMANAQPGDLIFFQGTYSTPNTVTHIGIYIGNGQMIHAGKPVQYASINTPYWQDHFYAVGRLP